MVFKVFKGEHVALTTLLFLKINYLKKNKKKPLLKIIVGVTYPQAAN
jgi:hypothetical protein